METCSIWDTDFNSDNWKDSPGDLWHLWHWLQFLQLRTWIHDNHCYLTINCDTGQHSQFLRCLNSWMEDSRWDDHSQIYVKYCFTTFQLHHFISRFIQIRHFKNICIPTIFCSTNALWKHFRVWVPCIANFLAFF